RRLGQGYPRRGRAAALDGPLSTIEGPWPVFDRRRGPGSARSAGARPGRRPAEAARHRGRSVAPPPPRAVAGPSSGGGPRPARASGRAGDAALADGPAELVRSALAAPRLEAS